jgi:catalase
MKMITNSKQVWEAGKTVKVGFTTLQVVAAVATAGDYAPDAYILVNNNGTKLYKFVPHKGLQSVSVDEANELIGAANEYAAQQAAKVIAQARTAGNLALQLLAVV